MSTTIHWLCHAPTRAMRDAKFAGAGDPVDESGTAKARALAEHGLRHDRAVASPAMAAQDTAAALALSATTEPGLRDIDHGRWSGLSIIDVQAAEPELLAAWIADPSRTTPGGESFSDMIARVGNWMEGQTLTTDRIIAVTHPTIIRAAILTALRCPVASVFDIDILPLACTTMSFNGKWRLQSLNVGLSAV